MQDDGIPLLANRIHAIHELCCQMIYWVRLKGFYAVGRFTANISENSKQADSVRLSGQRREVQNRPSLLVQLSSLIFLFSIEFSYNSPMEHI